MPNTEGVGDPTREFPLFDDVDPVEGETPLVTTNHTRCGCRNRTSGGVLEYVALRGERLVLERNDYW